LPKLSKSGDETNLSILIVTYIANSHGCPLSLKRLCGSFRDLWHWINWFKISIKIWFRTQSLAPTDGP